MYPRLSYSVGSHVASAAVVYFLFWIRTHLMSLPRLTALSTQTLSLLLERQRLLSLSPNATGLRSASPLHLPQITRNLKQLRAGVLELEKKEGRTEASDLLRAQYERMKGMLGADGEEEGMERFVGCAARRRFFAYEFVFG
jgi:hypothetical protein